MPESTINLPLPDIVVSELDYDRLVSMVAAVNHRTPEVAEDLLAELERARVVGVEALPSNVVRIGSTITFRSDDTLVRRVALVLPADANIAKGKISILTPVGTALLGLSPGQTISCRARDGQLRRLTVLDVAPPGTEASHN